MPPKAAATKVQFGAARAKPKMMVKRLSDPVDVSSRVEVQIRATTAIRAPLVATVSIPLDAVLADVRSILVEQCAATKATAAAAAAMSETATASYPLDLSSGFRFIRGGGLRAVRLSAEQTTSVADALPLLPPFGNPDEAFAPRFQFSPAAETVVLSAPSVRVPDARGKCTVRQPTSDGARSLRERVLVLYVAVDAASDSLPRVDAALSARLALHLDSFGKLATPKQVAEHITRATANMRDLLGRTPLHDAACSGNAAVVNFLTSLSFVRVDAGDERGESALHMASARGHVDVVAALLSAGADPLRPAGAVGANPGETPLHAALDHRFDGVVDALCRAVSSTGRGRAELCAAVDAYGRTPLSVFAELSPPLEELVTDGNVAAVRALRSHMLHAGDELTQVTAMGESLLHAAARSGSSDMVALIVDALKSDPALLSKTDVCGNSALHTAASEGSEGCLRVLMKRASLDPAATNATGRTPAHQAAYGGRWDALGLLVDAAPDAEAALAKLDNAGFSPLHVVAASGPPTLLRTLAAKVPAAVHCRAALERSFSLPREGREVPRTRKELARFLNKVRGEFARPRQIEARVSKAKSEERQARGTRKVQVVGPSALWCAVHSATGLSAANERATAAVHVLLSAGAGRSDDDTPASLLGLVSAALRRGCIDIARSVLKLVPAEAASTDEVALAAAAEAKDEFAIRWLLEHGVGTSACSTSPTCAIALCCEGAASDERALRTLRLLLSASRVAPPGRLLVDAARRGDTGTVRELVRAGVRVGGEEGADAPLAAAAAAGHESVVRSLLGYNAVPRAVDRNGVGALRLALDGPSSAGRRQLAVVRGFDLAAAALIKAGAPYLHERGVNHPVEQLRLAAANGLWEAADAMLNELRTVSAEELRRVFGDAPEPTGREFREVPAPASNGSRLMRPPRRPVQRALPRRYLPVGGTADAPLPRHLALCRSAHASAACGASPSAHGVLEALLFELRLPVPDIDSMPWLHGGDCCGMTAADHALSAGSVASAVALLAAGALPAKHTELHHPELAMLQTAAHAAAQAAQNADGLSSASRREHNAALVLGGLLRNCGDALNSADPTQRKAAQQALAGPSGITVRFVRAVARVLDREAFDAWCTTTSAVKDAVAQSAEAVLEILTERMPVWPSQGPSHAAALLATALLAPRRTHPEGDRVLDLVRSKLPRSGGGSGASIADLSVVPRNDLDPASFKRFKARAGASATAHASEPTNLVAICAVLRDVASAAALLSMMGATTSKLRPAAADACLTAATEPGRDGASTDVRMSMLRVLAHAGVKPQSAEVCRSIARFAVAAGQFSILSTTKLFQCEASVEALASPTLPGRSPLVCAVCAGDAAAVASILDVAAASAGGDRLAVAAVAQASGIAEAGPMTWALRAGNFDAAVLLLAHNFDFAPHAAIGVGSRTPSAGMQQGAATQRSLAARSHPTLSKSRTQGLTTKLRRPARAMAGPTRLCCRLQAAHMRAAAFDGVKSPVLVAAATADVELLRAFAAVASNEQLGAAGRAVRALFHVTSDAQISVPAALFAAVPTAADQLLRCLPVSRDATAAPATLVAVILGYGPHRQAARAALAAAFRWGVRDVTAAVTCAERPGAEASPEGGRLADLGPAALPAMACAAALRVGRGGAFRPVSLSPLGAAVLLGDAECVALLLANGGEAGCSRSIVVPAGVNSGPTSFAVPVLMLALDQLARSGHGDRRSRLAVVEALVAHGALSGGDTAAASSAALLLARLRQWKALRSVLDAAAESAIESAPSQVPAAQARRCIGAVELANVSVVLRGHLDSGRHVMHAAITHDAAHEDFVAIARFCHRRDVEGAVDARGRTCMGLAAAKGSCPAFLDTLLKIEVSPIDSCGPHRRTPLMEACRAGSLLNTTRLVAALEAAGHRGPDALNQPDARGWTALMHACARGHDEVSEFLLGIDADVHAASKNGSNATMLAIENGHAGIALSLVRHWARPADLTTSTTTALHAVARSGLHAVAVALLENAALDPADTVAGKTDALTGHSPLYLARGFGHAKVLRAMLSAVAARDEQLMTDDDAAADASTPLYADDAREVAASSADGVPAYGWLRGAAALAESVLSRSALKSSSIGGTGLLPGEARFHPTASLGRYLRPWAGVGKRAQTQQPLLRWAAEMGGLVVIRALSDLNVLDDCSALHAAAAANQVEACRLLLALRMADITAIDRAGRTAVHAAVEACAPDAAAFLLEQWPLPHHAGLLLFGGEVVEDGAGADDTDDECPPEDLPVALRADGNALLHRAVRDPSTFAAVLGALVAALPDPSVAAGDDAHRPVDDELRAQLLRSEAQTCPLRYALLAEDSAGITPLEAALMVGAPAAALRVAVALHGPRPPPIALPVAPSRVLRCPALSAAARVLLFDAFRMEDALLGSWAPPAHALEAASRNSGSSDDDAEHDTDAAPKDADVCDVGRPARLGAPDVRLVGLERIVGGDDGCAEMLERTLGIEHERAFAFRAMIKAIALPLRISFRFDSIAHLEPGQQLFLVRRLAASGLLGRYPDALQALPDGTVSSVALEFVPNPEDTGVSVRGAEVAERFSLQDDVLVTGDLAEAFERAYGTDARRMRQHIQGVEVRNATERVRRALAQHPVFRHMRLSVDMGRLLERGDASSRLAVFEAARRAVAQAADALVAAVGEPITGLTLQQLAAVSKAGADGPTGAELVLNLDRDVLQVAVDEGETAGLRLVLRVPPSRVSALRITAACREAFGRVARADAALVRAHVIRDVFTMTLVPRALAPHAPSTAPAVRLKLEVQDAPLEALDPRGLATTLRSVAGALSILTKPLHADLALAASGSEGHAAKPKPRGTLADAIAERRVAKAVLDSVRQVVALFNPAAEASVRCTDGKIRVTFGADGGPHRDDIVREVAAIFAAAELDRAKGVIPAIATDASQRLHTYLPQASLNVDISSLATAYPGDTMQQLTALGVLAFKRGALVLVPLVQALGIGWDSRLGAAIRARVRTVHVTVVSDRPSSLDLLPGGQVVYTVNPLTSVPANGGAAGAQHVRLPDGSRGPALGAGLLGAQAIASRVVIAVARSTPEVVDATTAFACWSRLGLRFKHIEAARPGDTLFVAVEPRNVFNEPIPAEAPPEPFAVAARIRVMGESTGEAATARVRVELAAIFDEASSRWEYRGRVVVPPTAVGSVLLAASLHGQPLIRSPLRVPIAPGEVDVEAATVVVGFDTLVVGRATHANIVLRDAAGSRIVGPASRMRGLIRVEGPTAGPVAVGSHTVLDNGTIRVELEPRRAELAASVIMRLQALDADGAARGPPRPLSVPVDVLTPEQAAAYRDWSCGRGSDESAKRRADRIGRFFHRRTRDKLADKLAVDAQTLGAVARQGRRFPRAYVAAWRFEARTAQLAALAAQREENERKAADAALKKNKNKK